MALPKKSTQGDGEKLGLGASRPDPLSFEIPDWLREKYPDYAAAFDALRDYNDRLMDYLIQLEERISELEG
jgi:hypothetical protein